MRDLVLVGSIAAMIALGIVWHFSPGIIVCGLYWTSAITFNISCKCSLMVPGALCNAAATLANDGIMPVYGLDTIDGIHGPWGPDVTLPILCDQFLSSSIGDVLLLIAGVFYLGRWVYRRFSPRAPLAVN